MQEEFMKKFKVNPPKKLSRLVEAHSALLKNLLRESPMIPGAYREVFVKCGKVNCWCQKGQGHLFRRITWSKNGESKTKSIPLEDTDWIVEVTENYRNFRKRRRELSILQTKMKSELNTWENRQIRITRKLKKYFENL